MHQRHLQRVVLLAMMLLVAGCSQHMKIKVERLKLQDSADHTHQDPVQLQAYLTGTLQQNVALANAALRGISDVLDSSPSLMNEKNTLPETNIGSLITEGDVLLGQIKALKIESIPDGAEQLRLNRSGINTGKVRILIAQARDYLDRANNYAHHLKPHVAEAAKRAEIELRRKRTERARAATDAQRFAIDDEIQSLDSQIAQTVQIESYIQVTKIASERGQTSRLTFGGFTNNSVHMISPGDPMYANILNAKPFDNAITEVNSKAYGDSTIMFVQESPTQMRVFSVDVDGTQLAQNIMLITDKALQAAVNYLSPFPIPKNPEPKEQPTNN